MFDSTDALRETRKAARRVARLHQTLSADTLRWLKSQGFTVLPDRTWQARSQAVIWSRTVLDPATGTPGTQLVTAQVPVVTLMPVRSRRSPRPR